MSYNKTCYDKQGWFVLHDAAAWASVVVVHVWGWTVFVRTDCQSAAVTADGMWAKGERTSNIFYTLIRARQMQVVIKV